MRPFSRSIAVSQKEMADIATASASQAPWISARATRTQPGVAGPQPEACMGVQQHHGLSPRSGSTSAFHSISIGELDFVQLVDGVGDMAELNVDSDGDFLFSGSCPRHWKSPGVEQQPRMRELGYKSKLCTKSRFQPRQCNISVGQPRHEVRLFRHVSNFCTKQHYARVRAVQGRLTDEAGTYV